MPPPSTPEPASHGVGQHPSVARRSRLRSCLPSATLTANFIRALTQDAWNHETPLDVGFRTALPVRHLDPAWTPWRSSLRRSSLRQPLYKAEVLRVSDGTRTRDRRDHNPAAGGALSLLREGHVTLRRLRASAVSPVCVAKFSGKLFPVLFPAGSEIRRCSH